jgi:hypothetical protein
MIFGPAAADRQRAKELMDWFEGELGFKPNREGLDLLQQEGYLSSEERALLLSVYQL